MCGFAGILYFNPKQKVDPDSLNQAVKSINHRGPDAQGTCISGSAGLGHCRLKIIDITDAANQPMTNEDSSIILAANGEIYNYRQLRKKLIRKGHKFRSIKCYRFRKRINKACVF